MYITTADIANESARESKRYRDTLASVEQLESSQMLTEESLLMSKPQRITTSRKSKDLSSRSDYLLHGTKASEDSVTKHQKYREDDLTHELIIGMYVANYMNMLIPNFARVDNGMRRVCTNDNFDVSDNPHFTKSVVYSSVTNTNSPIVTLSQEIAEGISDSRFLNYYIQILLALAMANSMFDYTHYDLHADNVAIKRLPEDMQIKYLKHYVKCNKVPVIIDYDYSHAVIEDVYNPQKHTHHGKYHLPEYFIYPDQSHPMHDPYKLLLSCAITAQRYNNQDVYEMCRTLLQYFNKSETLETVISQQEKYYYCIPKYIRGSPIDLSIDGMIAYILKSYTCSFISTNKHPVPLTLSVDVQSLYDYYDQYCFYSRSARDSLTVLNDIYQNEYYNMWDAHIETIESMIRDLNIMLVNIQLYDPTVLDIEQIKDPVIINSYRNNYTRYRMTKSTITQINYLMWCARKVAAIWKHPQGITQLETIEVPQDKFKSITETLVTVDNAIEALLQANAYNAREIVQEVPLYQWYNARNVSLW